MADNHLFVSCGIQLDRTLLVCIAGGIWSCGAGRMTAVSGSDNSAFDFDFHSVIAVNKLHKNLVDTDFTVRGNSIHVNLSVGVNQCSEEDTPETITESVDALMQKAKLTEGTHICHPD